MNMKRRGTSGTPGIFWHPQIGKLSEVHGCSIGFVNVNRICRAF